MKRLKEQSSEYSADPSFDFKPYESLEKAAEVARFSHYVIKDVLFKEPALDKKTLTKTVCSELRKFRALAGPERDTMPAPLCAAVLKIIWGGA